MRIIAGSARGRRLRLPRGGAVRPTAERVRQPLFSMLEALGASWEMVLDLYAGTGALGMEAMSRGGAWVDFVDASPRSCEAIRANLRTLGLAQSARVFPIAARRALGLLKGPYTVVFLDPPYGAPETVTLLQELAAGPLLAEGALVAWEHTARQEAPEAIGSLSLVRARRYGDSALAIYRRGGDVE